MSKRLWIIVIVLVAAFAGMAWINKPSDKQNTASGAKVTVPVYITGNVNSKIKLVEYSDFQCYYCGLFYPVVEQVVAKYKDQISFEYRNYPLSSIHKNAFAAARAAEAAGNQNKFWEMHHQLFSAQAEWESSTAAQSIFEGYAKQLGLNMAQYRKDFASSATNSVINASIAEFNKRGLTKATPTFLLNDKKIEVSNKLDDFSKVIDAALASANK